MNIKLAIADADEEYLRRLVNGLESYELSISIFTDVDALYQALSKKSYDVILFDPDISSSRLNIAGVKLGIALYSDECRNASLYPGVDRVLKYQRISSIYAQILSLYADKAGMGDGFDKSDRTTLIAVYSPAGGTGKTTVAMAIASMLKSSGSDVLYLSLEQLAGDTVFHQYSEEGITALISELDSQNTNFELKTMGMAKRGLNDVSYIEGFTKIVDYWDTKADEIEALLTNLKRIGRFGAVIVDTGSCIDDIVKKVLEGSDRIVLVTSDSDTSVIKFAELSEQAFLMDYEKNISVVVNRCSKKTSQNIPSEWVVLGRVRDYGMISITDAIRNMCLSGELSVESLR